MRERHWLALFTSVLLLLGGSRTCPAQFPPPPDPAFGGPPAPMFGYTPPPATHISDYPPTMNPWPGVSPYDYQFSQHQYEQGAWNWEGNNRGEEPYFILEAMVSRFKFPNHTAVGDATAPPFTGAPFGVVTSGAFVNDIVGIREIQQDVVNEKREDPNSPGIRGTWGRFDPDDSGLEWIGWWSSDASWLFQRGLPGTEANPSTLRITAGLPLRTRDDAFTVPFDEFFKVIFDSEAFGSEVNWTLTPKLSNDWFKLRPMVGFRYLFIRERFMFEGSDSGLSLTFFDTGLPDLSDPIVPVAPSFQSFLFSSVRSHLAGPQIGLRYDMGGKDFKIAGATKVGLLANHERLNLHGNGIGNGFDPEFRQQFPFESEESHTHVSPIAETSIFLDARIFGFIPILKKIRFFEEATFRGGYSILGAWEVARPNDTIAWRAQPEVPQIDVSRTKWYISTWSFGLHWEF